MKKLIICLFVSTLLTPLSLFAQPSNYVKLGVNYSSFRTEGGKSKPGLTFGFGRDFYPIRSFNGFWGFEVSYTEKKVTLQNKTWPSGFNPMDSDIVIGDINVNIAFIEIPLRIGYTQQLKSETARLEVASGLVVSLPVNENNDGEIKDIIFLEPDEKGKFEFDYLRWQDVRVNSTLNWQIGLAFFYQMMGIDFRYALALGETKASRNLTIQDSIDLFQISLTYNF